MALFELMQQSQSRIMGIDNSHFSAIPGALFADPALNNHPVTQQILQQFRLQGASRGFHAQSQRCRNRKRLSDVVCWIDHGAESYQATRRFPSVFCDCMAGFRPWINTVPVPVPEME